MGVAEVGVVCCCCFLGSGGLSDWMRSRRDFGLRRGWSLLDP